MNLRYSIHREEDGPAFIGGAPGVAIAGGVIGALVGALMPMRLIEAASFQLYLDTMLHAATPPLGTTARIGTMLLLGAGGAAMAYAIARWRRVQPLDGGISDLLDRLRGVRAGDEEDAPPLRSMDRHPDAPARRPFSAARDIADDGWATDWQPMADAETDADAEVAPLEPHDAEDELLLDAAAVLPDDDAADAVADMATDPDDWQPEAETVMLFDAADPLAAEEARLAALLPEVHRDPVANAIDDYDLPPPVLSDWEQRPQSPDPIVPATVDTRSPADLVAEQPAVPPRMADRVAPPPLDLSVARLDDLIARLEAGLTRRAEPEEAAVPAVAVGGVSPPAPAPTQDNDPAYPHDPALAAALRTLRRMNAAG